MSFLPSFSSLAAPSTFTASSSSQQIFKPASLSYFTIFCPALKPPKKKRSGDSHNDSASAQEAHLQDEAEDEDARETAREAAQILFYTSRARAALKGRMLRQIGVAKGMIEFCSMVSKPSGTSRQTDSESSAKGRSWNVHSSKRRMILVEVESGVWVHASIDLPYTTRSPPAGAEPHAKVTKERHDALLPDVWLEESIRRAWSDWVLLNGCPAHILSQKAGRAGLERSLEKYFSVWAWSWDLELATNADVAQRGSLFTDCVEGFPVVARAPRAKLVQLMQSEAAQRIKRGKHGERDVVVLSETSMLWPPTDAGCFDSEDEHEDGDESSSFLKRSKSSSTKQDNASSPDALGQVDPQTKAELLRRVVSHLTGLEKERDLIRAASASSTSDGRKRGTSGAIRERGSTSGNSKRDMRNSLLSASTSKRRVVSSPIVQQRATSASSVASSTTSEASKWSNWGSVFSGLGKLGFRGNADGVAPGETADAKAVDVAAEPEASDVSVVTADLSGVDTSVVDAAIPSSSFPMEAPAASKDASETDGAEASSPLQLFQQRLADAIPIQEAGGKMWNGAELAFRGISASLGLANASASSAPQIQADRLGTSAPSKPAQDGDVSDRDRFADASFDTIGADTDASVVTKVSILEPEVDVGELAEALGADGSVQDVSTTDAVQLADDSGADLVTGKKVVEPDQEAKLKLKLDTETTAVDPATRDPISPWNETRASDTASIKTSASAKAFASISVTSAAWYNTKALRSEAAITTSSPKFASAASIFSNTHDKPSSEHKDIPEPFETSLGGISVQSEHHDFELDGWGHEQPQPFKSFRCYVGESDVPVTHESLTLLQEQPLECTEYRVSFTTRRLLTLVLIERVPSTTGSTLAAQRSDTSSVLEDAWQLLRRLQRMLNDHARVAKAERQDDPSAVRFLHLDGPTLTFQSSLEDTGDAAVKMEEDVQVVAESHCVSAMELMRRHGVVETFSRSSNGKTWTASRMGKSKRVGDSANQTYMVLAGTKISIVDCDTELRKLANQYPSFGI
ncbi:uncharacterized protein SPSC_04769 [Sporisorium scitamineum]|uniref:CCZ1/INTU/HSP4 first Longin domain-containing protein n=1 Tax=Sporisorium scitamineum TaxID=49012 RepID=A0A0F7S6L8_9BASI|nr:uncharacterized protein SPSC_04769 [Sporisorium scitamineum]CDW95226.1 hypothetical protein [Sporisorium scitamineum]